MKLNGGEFPMNCSEVHNHLPAFLYGDLTAEERQTVQTHLADCAACRQEVDALRQVRELLGTVPTPNVQLNPLQLQQEALTRQEKKLRRWRRTAWVAVAGLAAALFLAVLPSLEFRAEDHQFVLRWGTPPPANPAPVPPMDGETLAKLKELEQRLHMLATLVNVQGEVTDQRDRQRDAELAAVRTQLAAVQLWVRAQIVESEKNLTAVYNLSRKGENR
jgi:hypothetical protein